MEPIRIGFVPSYRFSWTDWTEQMRSECIRVLSGLPHVEVVHPLSSGGGSQGPSGLSTPHGAVHSLDEAEAVAAAFAARGVDALVLCPLDFGDERSACAVADRLRVPVLLFATREPAGVDDATLGRVSDSYCGNLSIAAGLHRRGIAFRFGGIFFPNDEGLARELRDFVRAASVVKGVRGGRIGQIGVRPEAFETVAYDEIALARKLGQTVIPTNLDEVVDEALRLGDGDAEVLAIRDEIRSSVPTITVSEDAVLRLAKLEVALLRLVSRQHLQGLAMQCWPTVQRTMGVSLCSLFGRLTGKRVMTACETDVLGTLSMVASYRAALGDTVPHFIDWTIQHREDANLLLAWHCGNAPVCLAARRDEVALRSRQDMRGELPVQEGDTQAGLHQFQIAPGGVTFCRIAELDGTWKMLIARGEIVPSRETLSGTWSWVRVADHERLYRTLVEQGFIHHASMIHGDHVAAMKQACAFLGMEPVVVE
jgi:L-fucose isomerase-like protein